MLLATSWTWCIGMFLPVLLLRDFGLWGWAAFAAPNVIGAALLGRWQYQHAGRSLLDQHKRAMVWFSIITVAFHVFFIAWFAQRLLGQWAMPMFVTAVLVFTVFIRAGKAGLAGWLALILSAMAACSYFATMGMGQPPVVLIDLTQTKDLLLLWPAIIIGFVFCPHMDLTLQRVRGDLPPSQRRPTFAAAFLGVFLLMITFTLFYAGSLQLTLSQGRDLLLPASVAVAIGIHLCVQGGITTALHASEIIRKANSRHIVRSMLLFVVVMVGLLVLGRAIAPGTSLLGYDPGEVVYRMFIGFYGLTFPAYAWAAWVWRNEPKLSLAAWLAPALIAMPMFTAGFLAHRPVWIVPGVAIILLMPVFMRPSARPGQQSAAGAA